MDAKEVFFLESKATVIRSMSQIKLRISTKHIFKEIDIGVIKIVEPLQKGKLLSAINTDQILSHVL